MADAKDTRAFQQAAMASRRLRSVRVAFYANERSDVVEKQFSAVTLYFPAQGGEAAYLSFRGTDGSFAGWKEDFNLCFKNVIPSQRAAAAYLSGVASACRCPLVIAGTRRAATSPNTRRSSPTRGLRPHRGVQSTALPRRSVAPSVRARFAELLQKIAESSAFGMISSAARRLPRRAVLGHVGVPARAVHLADRRKRLRVPGSAQSFGGVLR
ncbi:MAG: Mbeg1-like protein [Eggerthellaceae bacterium]